VTGAILRGVPGSPGAALGPAWMREEAVARGGGSPDEEAMRVRQGFEAAADELEALAARLDADGRTDEAEIVAANHLMAGDQTLVEAAVAATMTGLPAALAIERAAAPHAEALAALDDPVLAARAADLRAVARRAGELIDGNGREPPPASVVVAADLGPGEVAAWASRIDAICLAEGSAAAHAAIVARSLGIPLVVALGEGLMAVADGEELGVDGTRGVVMRAPHGASRRRLSGRIAAERRQAERDRAEREQPPITRDGRRIRLLANAGSAAEVHAALEAGAEGIGLLRSELAFLEADGWPDEAAHRRALSPMLAPLAGRLATVRTLDFGADKTPPFLIPTQRGAGLLAPRGIRLALAAADGVAPQLRAMLAVAGEAQLRVLVPMVTEAAELDAVRAMANAARDTVAPGSPDPVVGAMVEVPAAALNARVLARHADFLSIGTNDLVQYTLAADRQNPDVAERAVAYHPAVLRLIGRVVTAAQAVGIPVDVCGEAAGDPELLPLLVGLGVDELSVSPGRLAATRRLVRSLDAGAARVAVHRALGAETAAQVAAFALAALPRGGGSADGREQAGHGVKGG
jgi:phosphoenolpyruvate-protein phosphotransferase